MVARPDPDGEMIKDGNWTFVFEVTRLCVGHLGHLHHKIDDGHFADTGRLDEFIRASALHTISSAGNFYA